MMYVYENVIYVGVVEFWVLRGSWGFGYGKCCMLYCRVWDLFVGNFKLLKGLIKRINS